MKPERNSKILLGITRSKAKLIEFSVPEEHWIETPRDPAGLFPISIGIVGDLASAIARSDESKNILADTRQELRFAASFFDSYQAGLPNYPKENYLTLLTAAAYYLCDLPGSSAVLTKRFNPNKLDPDSDELDLVLHWLLKGAFEKPLELKNSEYRKIVFESTDAICNFYLKAVTHSRALNFLKELRGKTYFSGAPRPLLLSDLIFAVAKRRIENSSRICLPQYTRLDSTAWEEALKKPSFVREFWPAQRLLGEQGVFGGRSAIVQMPTSAGKTRATEILIRSAFLSKRTLLAVVVAPFRALCHEIRDSLVVAFRNENIQVNEISDVPQSDFHLELTVGQPQILILTPEKLFYLLRQSPDTAPQIGLLVYDEGHQFDSGIRGVTYELLVSSLKKVVPTACQVVLISAVISNAKAINDWLNGENGLVVAGTDLHPTIKSVAFASWQDSLGRLEFLGHADSGNHEFFVPRVIESLPLRRFSSRENERVFPQKGEEETVALYLALKLVPNGTVAVFCGKKNNVTTLCKSLADAYRRDLNIPKPLDYSDHDEVAKLAALVAIQLGEGNSMSQCAELGVFTHHGNIPMGIRLAVEHAIKNGLVKMVICTSTLAQGVNLPIRYLIVTGVYQGKKPIKVRDFQNLMGRAGRSGMHTEGSVIFANPATFDERNLDRDGSRRWTEVQELLDPSKAEHCESSLLSLFDPLYAENGALVTTIIPANFYKSYLDDPNRVEGFADSLIEELRNRRPTISRKYLLMQLEARAKIVDALESFMMASATEDGTELSADGTKEIAQGTLAYHLATEEQRKDLETVFRLIGESVLAKVPGSQQRKVFSKSLFGVSNSIAIQQWTQANREAMTATDNDEQLLAVIWPALGIGIGNSNFKKCTKPELLFKLAIMWIDETTPAKILEFFEESEVRFGDGERPHHASLDHIIDLCESAISYESILVLSAICESLKLDGPEDDRLVQRLEHLQKRLKYGLKTSAAIVLYEMGFADRIVVGQLVGVLRLSAKNKHEAKRALSASADLTRKILAGFPNYYESVWNSIAADI